MCLISGTGQMGGYGIYYLAVETELSVMLVQTYYSAVHHFSWLFTTSLNTFRPRQNGRYVADDIFKRIFLNETVLISLKISLKFVAKVRINIPALVQIMA